MPFDKRKFTKKLNDKYSFKDETFKRVHKNNIRDLVELEIGDAKTPDKFMPQHKIMRWQNECNVSIRLKDDGNGTETVETREDKIVWKKGKREAHFYDLTNEEHPEGAQEFEIVLLEKPATNVVEFTLQDKDVEYFYQPALTPEEIAEGAERPENVVGSYAVYAKTPKTNWKGGKEYKTGKVGHIFRPRIEDSNGKWTWGDLHIENGILSVTIPQEFLNKATYPVKHAAGLTFGYTSVGGTAAATAANITNATTYASPEAGTVTAISKYGMQNGSSPVNVKLLAYDDTGAAYPNSKLALSSAYAEVAYLSPNWTTKTLGTTFEVVAANYWLGFIDDNATNGDVYYYDVGSTNQRYSVADSYASPASTYPGGGTGAARKVSIYATYLASGFPVVESVTDTDITSSLTSHVVNMPATVNSGDRLIAIAHYRNAGTWSTIPTGWTNLAEQAGGGSVGEMLICEKIADGTEDGGTATWITGTGTTAAWQVIRISGAHASTASEVGTTSGDSSNADPPSKSISGWSGENTLWIAVAGHSASSTAAWSAGSLGFTTLVTNGASSGGSACCVAHCYNTDSSDTVNPGAFTASGSNRWWAAATIAVRPAGGGGGGSPTPTLMLMGMGT